MIMYSCCESRYPSGHARQRHGMCYLARKREGGMWVGHSSLARLDCMFVYCRSLFVVGLYVCGFVRVGVCLLSVCIRF